jgi:UPF0176 protein
MYYDPLAAVPNLSDLIKSKAVSKKVPEYKTIHWQRHSFYSKLSVGEFLIEENEIKIGDKILIIGATTGEQEL